MNALFFEQLKNTPWIYADIVVDADGETMTVATLIERYKELKNALADVQSMAKPTAKHSTKAKAKAKTDVKTEKSDAHQSSIE